MTTRAASTPVREAFCDKIDEALLLAREMGMSPFDVSELLVALAASLCKLNGIGASNFAEFAEECYNGVTREDPTKIGH